MTKKIIIITFLLALGFVTYGQESNVIIQVNDKLVLDGFANSFVKVNYDGKLRSFPVDYTPGKLKLSEKVWNIISQDSTGKFNLHFDFYTFKKQKSKIANFKAELTLGLLKSDYLIINIYDFRDRKYRKWYGPYTDEKYLVEFRYPNGPIHVRHE
tara:strand:- start:1838 stop:2302 length:465 start_codon:yes stop_codon:yes gene_type:complete